MLIEKRKIERSESTTKKKKPTIINWNDAKLLRSHSITECSKEILRASQKRGFVKVNLIGASSSGKTNLGDVLAHQLHELDETFEVNKFKDFDLIDFKKTIERLSKNNQILIFDDLSGLVANYGKQALEKLKSEITTIRHIGETNQDRRIVMILNFHAQKMLDKSIRISNFTFYTECQLEEIGYLEELLGKKYKYQIAEFAKKKSQSTTSEEGKFSFTLSKGNAFTYKDSEPFRLMLYNNGSTTRFIVAPKLSWIITNGGENPENSCEICFPADKSAETKMNLEQFVEDFSFKFNKGVAKKAVELKLRQRGYYAQSKRVAQAERYIELFFDEKKINLEELAMAYGLEEKKTRLDTTKLPYKPHKKKEVKE